MAFNDQVLTALAELPTLGSRSPNDYSVMIRNDQPPTSGSSQYQIDPVDMGADTSLIRRGTGNIGTLKHNYSATVEPTVDDDVTFGYAVGSTWWDVTGLTVWVCIRADDTNAKWWDITDLGAGGGGETNTASNVGSVSAIDIFKQKTGVDLEFRGVNAGSSKITVVLDGANNEIDIDFGSVASSDLSNAAEIFLRNGSIPLTGDLRFAAGGFIDDSGGFPMIKFTSTPSAVGYVEFKNAVDVSNFKILARGGTIIGLEFGVTGSGSFTFVGDLDVQGDITLTGTGGDVGSHIAASVGVHGISGSVVGTAGAQTLSSKTIAGGNLNSCTLVTNSLITGATGLGFRDSTGLDQLRFSEVALAVNHIDISNNATTFGPIILATGTDTNVDLQLNTKGAGEIVLNANLDVQGDITLTGTVDGVTVDAHAARHQSGGADAIKLDDLAAPDVNTDLDVSTTKHGLCPKLPNDVTKFLNGIGGYTVPGGGGTETIRINILGWQTVPDSSKGCYFETYARGAANDRWKPLVLAFPYSNTPAIKAGCHGAFTVPKNYNTGGTTKLIIVWTAPSAASGTNVVFDFEYRAVGGNDTESLDQNSVQETGLTVTDAEPSLTDERMETSITLTNSNFLADDNVQFILYRDNPNASDDLVATVTVFGVYFEYTT